MAPERSEAAREVIRHRCETPGCYQVLAVETQGGDIKPVVIGWSWDKEGRAYVHCPDCGKRKRLPIRRVV